MCNGKQVIDARNLFLQKSYDIIARDVLNSITSIPASRVCVMQTFSKLSKAIINSEIGHTLINNDINTNHTSPLEVEFGNHAVPFPTIKLIEEQIKTSINNYNIRLNVSTPSNFNQKRLLSSTLQEIHLIVENSIRGKTYLAKAH